LLKVKVPFATHGGLIQVVVVFAVVMVKMVVVTLVFGSVLWLWIVNGL